MKHEDARKGAMRRDKVERVEVLNDAEFEAMLARFKAEEREPDDTKDWPDFQAHEFWTTVNDVPVPGEEDEGLKCPNGHPGCWKRECWMKKDTSEARMNDALALDAKLGTEAVEKAMKAGGEAQDDV